MVTIVLALAVLFDLSNKWAWFAAIQRHWIDARCAAMKTLLLSQFLWLAIGLTFLIGLWLIVVNDEHARLSIGA